MYLERYTNELNQIENDEMAASMFKDGLARDHELYEKLTKKPARRMAEVILKVEGCVRVEEAGLGRYKPKKKCRGTTDREDLDPIEGRGRRGWEERAGGQYRPSFRIFVNRF